MWEINIKYSPITVKFILHILSFPNWYFIVCDHSVLNISVYIIISFYSLFIEKCVYTVILSYVFFLFYNWDALWSLIDWNSSLEMHQNWLHVVLMVSFHKQFIHAWEKCLFFFFQFLDVVTLLVETSLTKSEQIKFNNSLKRSQGAPVSFFYKWLTSFPSTTC